MRTRVDLQITVNYENYYVRNVLRPFIRKTTELIKNTGFRNYTIPKKFRRTLISLVKNYTNHYQKSLEYVFTDIDKKIYEYWFHELEKQLPKKFRYKRTEYLIDNSKKRILKRTGERWLTLMSLNTRATFEIWKYYAEDGLSLSDRIWKYSNLVSDGVKKQVLLSLQTGMSAKRLRNQILATAEQNDIEIPKWLERQLKNATPDEIARKVATYIEKKQKYNALRIARTEIQRAWRVSYVTQAKQLPFVKGIKWNLSGSHPKQDICDELASADPVGLGAGVYPPNAVPYNGGPAHPHCMCYLTSVLDEENII